MFVVIFNNVFGLKKGSNKVFNDTKGHWAKEAIDIAIDALNTNIYGVKTFPPGRTRLS